MFTGIITDIGEGREVEPVSYTDLTLPTKRGGEIQGAAGTV